MWIWMLERNNKLLKNWWFLKRKRMQTNSICKNGLLKIMFFWFRRLVASSRSTFEVFGVIFGCLWASQMGGPRWVPLLPGPTKGQEGPGRLPGTDFGGFRGCILNDFVDFQFGFCYISKDFGGEFPSWGREGVNPFPGTGIGGLIVTSTRPEAQRPRRIFRPLWLRPM